MTHESTHAHHFEEQLQHYVGHLRHWAHEVTHAHHFEEQLQHYVGHLRQAVILLDLIHICVGITPKVSGFLNKRL
jgi:hypothetical protein